MRWKMFWIAVILIMIIWGSLFFYIVKYGEDVKRDPCSVCAERIGDKVTCVYGTSTIAFYPSGKIEDESGENLQFDKG